MENLLVYYFPRIWIREAATDYVHLVFINSGSSVSFLTIDSYDVTVPSGEIEVDAYD